MQGRVYKNEKQAKSQIFMLHMWISISRVNDVIHT